MKILNHYVVYLELISYCKSNMVQLKKIIPHKYTHYISQFSLISQSDQSGFLPLQRNEGMWERRIENI